MQNLMSTNKESSSGDQEESSGWACGAFAKKKAIFLIHKSTKSFEYWAIKKGKKISPSISHHIKTTLCTNLWKAGKANNGLKIYFFWFWSVHQVLKGSVNTEWMAEGVRGSIFNSATVKKKKSTVRKNSTHREDWRAWKILGHEVSSQAPQPLVLF